MSSPWLVQAVLVLAVAGYATATYTLPSPWTWRCVPSISKDSRCVKERKMASTSGTMTHAACQLTCGVSGTLWPEPRVGEIGNAVTYFRPVAISHSFTASHENTQMLSKGIEVFLDNLDRYHPKYKSNKNNNDIWITENKPLLNDMKIVIEVIGNAGTRPTLETDESYKLTVESIGSTILVKIITNSYFGARHGLETLSQLIDYDQEQNSLQVVNFAVITDSPSYKYRGILLDTSRNFITVPAIERTLDAMAANKLNTFHWHITDSHSFPLVMKSLPNMAFYGSYSSEQQYYPEDVRHLVEYGRVRGIRILPEFDAPAHVGNGWEWGPQENLGNLAVCVNQEPWQDYCVEPPCGQLNIANKNIYPVLGKVYKEIVDMFGPIDLFHYGGDEVNLNCWNTTEEIVLWMKNLGSNLSANSYYEQWSTFQDRSTQLLTEANSGVQVPGILWTSHLTEKGRADRFLDTNRYIIQIWTTGDDPLIKELLDKKFRLIFSNYDSYYLDCGFGAWVGEGNNWCSPYKGWQKVYDNSPMKIALNLTNGEVNRTLILGGEAALWTEQVDDSTIDSRLWPRGAALGERLWSDPDHNWAPAEYRMIHQRQRLVKRGVKADRLQPEWCHQNEGLCYLRGNELP